MSNHHPRRAQVHCRILTISTTNPMPAATTSVRESMPPPGLCRGFASPRVTRNDGERWAR
jgi:hypothetical protein